MVPAAKDKTPDTGEDDQRENQPEPAGLVQPEHDIIVGKSLAVDAHVGDAIVHEPAEMRVEHAFQLARLATAAVEPGAVDVADFVAMGMMAPVIGGPAEHRRLDRHLRHRAQYILHRHRCIERLV